MIYLASPYSHPDPEVRKDRFMAAASFTSDALSKGFLVFSPIAYGHPLAEMFSLPTDALAWESFNAEICSRCSAMWLLQLEGWKESRGVEVELNTARFEHIPVIRWTARGEFDSSHYAGQYGKLVYTAKDFDVPERFTVINTPNTANG